MFKSSPHYHYTATRYTAGLGTLLLKSSNDLPLSALPTSENLILVFMPPPLGDEISGNGENLG